MYQLRWLLYVIDVDAVHNEATSVPIMTAFVPFEPVFVPIEAAALPNEASSVH